MADDRERWKEALMKKVTGYDYEEREIVLDRTGRDTGKVKVCKRHVPPDMGAIVMVKNMMDSGKW